MNTTWRQCTIGDVCDTISNTYNSNAQQVVLINTSDVLEGKVLNHIYIPNENLKGQFKKTFEEGDILYSEIRPQNKRYAYIDFAPINYIASTKLMVIRNKNIVKSKYLYYFLQSDKIISELQMLAETRSGTFPQITFNELSKLSIKIPPLPEQDRIISILDSICKKIDINQQINDNLEQQTQALFKSWFVDNPKPNWSETTFSEVANFIGGYSYKGEELTDSSNIAMVTIKNFGRNGGFKADGFKGIAPFVKLKECHYANLFDILVAHTDLTQNADVIGNAELLLTYGRYDGIILSMDLVKVLPKNNFPYRFLLAAMLKNKIFKGHCLGYVNGTTVLHLSKKALPNFEVKIPPKAEAKTMNDALAPYYQRMAEVLQENDRLIHLRDTLLPKLMSGELNINAKSRLQ